MRRTLFLPGFVCFLCLFAGSASRAQKATRPVLSDALPQLVWDAAERGSLLVVAADKTFAPTLPPGVQSDPPPPNGYRPNPLAERFSRQVMPVGTVTAFTPTTMTSLTADRLPKPNIYAELSEGDRMRLFQASLTDDQWRKLASPDGLGLGDLKPEQRDLFLVLLPNPLTVRRIIDDSGPEIRDEKMTLTDGQRSGVRLRHYKRLGWMFRTEKGGGIDAGRPSENPFHLDYKPHHVANMSGDVTVFGVKIKETVPNRQKRSHLRYDWSALDPRISLTGVATVGALVERIRTVTMVEIYADRRYADLSVYVRGESARAGDILRALALCVTGTYRQIGPAYVLTDDLVGLGVRHAALRIWADRALIGYQALTDSVGDGAEKRPTVPLGWSDGDPMKPSDDLQKRLVAGNAGMVAVRELPATAQRAIAQQLEEWRTHPPRFLEKNGDAIRSDAVMPVAETATELIVPNVGAIRADQLMTMPSFRRPGPERPRTDAAPLSPPPAVAEMPGIPRRAIAVSPRTEVEAAKAVTEAKRLGFSTLWVVMTPGGDTKPLEAAVRAGKEAGIPVVAAVRVLRSGGDKTLTPDVNILGETSSAAAARVALDGLPRPDGGSFQTDRNGFTLDLTKRDVVAEAERERRRGDWLRCDLPEVRAKAAARVAAVARIPGLAGLALLDLLPPGYRTNVVLSRQTGRPSDYTQTNFGFNPEMRLAFLRQTGVDPIDLGTLPDEPYLHISLGNFPSLELPFFADYGLTGKYANGNATYNKVSTYDMGARDVPEKWLGFRAGVGNEWIRQLVGQVQAAAPDLPLYGTPDDEPTSLYTWRGLARLGPGKAAADYLARVPVPNQMWPPEGGPRVVMPPPRRGVSGEAIREGAKESWLVAAYLPETDGDAALNFALQMQQALGAGKGPLTRGWDGVLLDLSESSIDSAFSLVDMVIKMPDAAPPGNGSTTKPL